MNKLVQSYIKKIYYQKDYQYFREKSKQTPLYLNPLLELVGFKCAKVITGNVSDEPAIEIWFNFEKYENDKFKVEYKTLLKISKVADLFVFQHEFCVENIDPNRMTPVLEGFGEEAYIFLQDQLEKEVSLFLEELNLLKLRLAEMDEVVVNLEIPQKSIFGSQMTLENALFRDLYGICEI